MTPKEKALRLCQQYGVITFATKHNDGYTLPLEMAKQCALIAVDEILNIDNIKPYILHKEIIKYYIEVKKEIENL
jgi:hypothetical protein